MDVTALVLHFRTIERTVECLRSLNDCGVLRVLLVDNSEDAGASVEAMGPELASLRATGLDIHVVSRGKNLGFAQGVNFGLCAASQSWSSDVLLINSDAWLQAGSLGRMCERLKLSALVVPVVRTTGSEEPKSLFGYYHKLFGLILREPTFGTVRHASGCCLLIRRDLAAPGLFDEDFFFYGEDAMLGSRLEQAGVVVSECDEAVVWHAGSASAKNGSMFYEYHMNRAHWLLARKMARNRIQYLAFLCGRMLSLPLRAAVRSFRLRSTVPWRALVIATFDVVKGRLQTFTPPCADRKRPRSSSSS